jgi:ZIP family zinc transporter/zinc and cadmium transporter
MGLTNILLYAFIAAGSAMLGTALVFGFREWSHKNSIFLISFSAGVMLAIAFLDLIPEASALYQGAWPMVFIGFLLLYTLQNIIMVHPCHDEECKTHLGLLSTVGLSIHSLLDGLIISVGFGAGWEMGVLTAIAVIFHKMPDGITITGILVHSNSSRKKILYYSLLVALFTPLGAAAGYFFLRGIEQGYVGALLALTSGSFIYLAASDLLPESHKVRHNGNAVSFFFGAGAVALIGYLLH